MICDYDNQFTVDGGQAIVGSAASLRHLDLRAADDIAVGEPLYLMGRVTEAFDNLTSLDVVLQKDTASTFGSPTPVITKNVLLAGLTLNALYNLGAVPVGEIDERYLRAYFTVNGGAPSVGKMEVWLVKGTERMPYNGAISL